MVSEPATYLHHVSALELVAKNCLPLQFTG